MGEGCPKKRSPVLSDALLQLLLQGSSKNQLFFVCLSFKSPPKEGKWKVFRDAHKYMAVGRNIATKRL